MRTNHSVGLSKLIEKSGFARWVQASFLLLALMAILGHETKANATNLVANSGFETVVSGNSLGTNGGYICKLGTTACVSNVGSWSSTCNGTAGNLSCGTGGTVASILYPSVKGCRNGCAFNGGIGLTGTIADSPTGGNYIAIDGDNVYSASISQTLTGVTIGSQYILSFYQAAAQQAGTTGATTEWWEVSFGSRVWNSTGSLGKMNNPSGGFTPWNYVSYSFTATAADVASPTLRFLAKSDNNNMGLPPVVLLDGVSLGTPEPGTFVLIGAGLLGMVAIKQKGKKADHQK